MSEIRSITDIYIRSDIGFIDCEYFDPRPVNNCCRNSAVCTLSRDAMCTDDTYRIQSSFPINDSTYKHRYVVDGTFALDLPIAAPHKWGNVVAMLPICSTNTIMPDEIKQAIRDAKNSKCSEFTMNISGYVNFTHSEDKTCAYAVCFVREGSRAWIKSISVQIPRETGDFTFNRFCALRHQVSSQPF